MGWLLRLIFLVFGIGSSLILLANLAPGLNLLHQAIPQVWEWGLSAAGQFLILLICHPLEESLHAVGEGLSNLIFVFMGLFWLIVIGCGLAFNYWDSLPPRQKPAIKNKLQP